MKKQSKKTNETEIVELLLETGEIRTTVFFHKDDCPQLTNAGECNCNPSSKVVSVVHFLDFIWTENESA